MRMRTFLAVLGLLAVLATPSIAQDIDLSGQIRPRFEARDPVGSGNDAFTSMRLRATLSATLEKDVRVFVQLQDVRLWGEETNTLGDFSADHVDFHQGWLEFGLGSSRSTRVRLGRQETNLGGQRLVGAVGWTQQGRSFDGARITARPSWGTLSLVGYQLADETAPAHDGNASLLGVYAVVDAGENRSLDLYALHNRVVDEPGAADTDQTTLGARYVAAAGSFSYRVEGSLQAGTRADLDVSAFMFGARVGTTVAEGKGSLTAWYDYLSGDGDPTDGDVEVFQTLFATNHKFYGFADLFLNIPAHTAGRGLQDFAVKGSLQASEALRLGLDAHNFRVAETAGMTDPNLGQELDFSGTYRYTGNLTFVGGFSLVLQGDGFAEIGRLTEDMKWGYFMVNASF